MIKRKGHPVWNKGLTKDTDQRVRGYAQKLIKNPPVQVVCVRCGSEFTVRAYRQDTAKYCSLRCHALANIAYGRYSSVAGWNKGLKCPQWSGRNHPNWKGGITETRKTWEYGQMVREVWKRDKYTCFLCGRRAGKLNAHHILPYSEFPEFKFTKANLVTLCKPCHWNIRGREWLYAPRFFESNTGSFISKLD